MKTFIHASELPSFRYVAKSHRLQITHRTLSAEQPTIVEVELRNPDNSPLDSELCFLIGREIEARELLVRAAMKWQPTPPGERAFNELIGFWNF